MMRKITDSDKEHLTELGMTEQEADDTIRISRIMDKLMAEGDKKPEPEWLERNQSCSGIFECYGLEKSNDGGKTFEDMLFNETDLNVGAKHAVDINTVRAHRETGIKGNVTRAIGLQTYMQAYSLAYQYMAIAHAAGHLNVRVRIRGYDLTYSIKAKPTERTFTVGGENNVA